MKCGGCGKDLKTSDRFCQFCGTPVTAEAGAGVTTYNRFAIGGDLDEPPLVKQEPEVVNGFYFPPDLNATGSGSNGTEPEHGRKWRKRGIYPAHEKSHEKARGQVFNRSPRLRVEYQREKVLIQKPPAASGKPDLNWLSILLPPIAMGVMVILVALLSGGISVYMIIMLPMQAISVVIAILNYRKQIKKYRDYSALRSTKYRDYLKTIRKKVEKANLEQLSVMNGCFPTPSECVDIVMHKRKNLWERRPDDDDFGCFRVGMGLVPAAVTPVWTDSGIAIVEDELEIDAAELGKRYKFISNAPIIIDNKSGVVGIVGDIPSTNAIVKSIALQLATFHSYEDLKIGVIFHEDDKADWAWTRWLPHVQDENGDLRMLASSSTGASVLKEKLLSILIERTQESENNPYTGYFEGPQYILILAAPELFAGNDFFSKITKLHNAGIRVIYTCRSVAQLPKECGHIVEATNFCGTTYERDKASLRTDFIADRLDEDMYEMFARTMAPIRLCEALRKNAIPNSITFLEGYGLRKIEDYDIGRAWQRGKMVNSFAVPIGIAENGEPFYFDIRDGKHGVHGLIGGMPGSGKSEMLQSWILSMAMNFSPQEVSFVMIDFKGTGLITPFLGLPHLAGTISNINETVNIRRNKESLEYELKRRQILFDKYGVQNIQAYIKLQTEGMVKERLPVLIVVLDEFAEFKKTFPEFMQWIESSFVLARSLGVWYLLATQQPSETASTHIKGNTHFKWCLKVNTAAASKEMIGIPDAVQISRPGRAYVKVSNANNVFLTQIQSFWSGAPYEPERNGTNEHVKIASVDLNGNRAYYSNYEGSTGYKTNKTEIEVVVEYIATYAKTNGIPTAARIWTDSLPERLALSEVCKEGFDGRIWPETKMGLRVAIGEVDDPKHQVKFPLVVPFTECGHIVVYGAPSTGKTTFLQTTIMSAALSYCPDDLNIYIMDFGSLSMRVFSAMPQVGDIVEMGQDERVGKLANLLRDELERRRFLFAKYGVGSIEAYRTSEVAEKLPYILLVVDNFNAAIPTYPELDHFFVTLTQSGSNYGMYLAASATGANGFSYKLQGNIKMTYALRMSDKSDYSLIVGRTDGLLPDNYMGRGLRRGDPPLQFQTALPADGKSDIEMNHAIRKIAQQMKDVWTGKSAKKIPEMPAVIHYGSIEGPGIHFGLSKNKVEPVSYDYQAQHYLMISGVPGSGKSNLLKVIAMQMYEGMQCAMYVLDINGGLSGLRGLGTYIDTAAEMDAFFDQLMPILKRREDTKKAERAESHAFSPLLVVIDDFGSFFSAVNEKTARRLLAIIKLCAGLGIFLIVAGDAGDLATKRVMGEEVTLSFASAKQLVMLGGTPNDHGAFRLKLTPNQRNIEVGETEGFYVDKNGIVCMKVMREKTM